MEPLLSVPENQIYETILAYAKIYPEMTKLFTYHQPIRARVAGYEPREARYKRRSVSDSPDPLYFIDSLRRTKTKISDIVVCNQFDLFCTFTFNCKPCPPNHLGRTCMNDGDEGCACDDATCKRYDVNFLKKRMSKWLDHQNQRVGKFAYLIVPEFHADHKAIHFHALFKGYRGELLDAHKKNKSGRELFRIGQYHFGWGDAVRIPAEDVPKVGSYIKKYVTKDMPQFNGQKRYWCSQGLERPNRVSNPVMFPDQMAKFTEEHEMQGITLRVAPERLDLISASHKGKLLN